MAHLGLVGIGVMGAAFALNLAEKGHTVSLLDRNRDKMVAVKDEVHRQGLQGGVIVTENAEDFIKSLPVPRAILTLVPAGAPLDSVIDMLRPLLAPEDMIADLGNSGFRDTERRTQALEAEGFRFLGMGISGGSEGARTGPAIMAGGSKDSWERIKLPLRDVAAKFEGDPCVDWFGPGGAGHFVKTLHNGIEYAIMQLIAEYYGVMRDGLDMPAQDIGQVFSGWNEGRLKSYLIEIAGDVAKAKDPKSNLAALDLILDRAGQKGTGRWSVVEALHLGVPNSMMAAAVEGRNLSAQLEARQATEDIFGPAPRTLSSSETIKVAELEAAMTAGKILSYTQGFEVLKAASKEFDWGMDMAAVARVWRAGCIIRSAYLDDIAAVFERDAEAILADSEPFADVLRETVPALRKVVSQAALNGLPVPASQAGLSFFDMRRTSRSTANMLQGLRDFFGAHGIERIDAPGEKTHGPWRA